MKNQHFRMSYSSFNTKTVDTALWTQRKSELKLTDIDKQTRQRRDMNENFPFSVPHPYRKKTFNINIHTTSDNTLQSKATLCCEQFFCFFFFV